MNWLLLGYRFMYVYLAQYNSCLPWTCTRKFTPIRLWTSLLHPSIWLRWGLQKLLERKVKTYWYGICYILSILLYPMPRCTFSYLTCYSSPASRQQSLLSRCFLIKCSCKILYYYLNKCIYLHSKGWPLSHNYFLLYQKKHEGMNKW